MIKINIKDNEIVISGHSGYGVSGSDIVCASISSIAITTINAILRIDENSLLVTKDDGFLKIDILKHTDIIDILINNMIDSFSELELQYKKNIKINK